MGLSRRMFTKEFKVAAVQREFSVTMCKDCWRSRRRPERSVVRVGQPCENGLIGAGL